MRWLEHFSRFPSIELVTKAAEDVTGGRGFLRLVAGIRITAPQAIAIAFGEAMGASRQFVDSFGFSWQAVEIVRDIASVEGPTSDNWLYFLSRGTTRRARTYPRDWEMLNWADLEDVCTRAEVVGTDAGSRPVRAFSERLRAVPG